MVSYDRCQSCPVRGSQSADYPDFIVNQISAVSDSRMGKLRFRNPPINGHKRRPGSIPKAALRLRLASENFCPSGSDP